MGDTIPARLLAEWGRFWAVRAEEFRKSTEVKK